MTSRSFAYTGASQDFVVPPGVTSVDFDLYGAAGGPSADFLGPLPGGLGGRLQATLAVTPGEVLKIFVGGVGALGTGGFNGGGPAGGAAGGGGGATDVRRGGTSTADRKLVAGGGGGASKWNDGTNNGPGGAGGGTTGQVGQAAGTGSGAGVGNNRNGGGGTPSAGGAAGNCQGGLSPTATAGSLGQGGEGARLGSVHAGGGGGGLYGGGGGGVNNSAAPFTAGGGGGGSSYADPAATTVTHTQGARTGNGIVVVHYVIPAPTLPPANATELVWVYDYAGAQTMALHDLLALELDDRLQQSEALRFTLAADDPKAGYVLVDTMARYRSRFYRIKRREPSRDGTRATIDVEAEALWIDLADRVIPGHFLLANKAPDDGLDLIVLHRDYGWTVGTVDAPAFAFYGIDKTDATILELLREWAKNTGCELVFDTAARTVSLLTVQGEERDLGFRYAWNLRGITRRESPPEVTRLYAYGRNGLTISALSPDGTEHIDDFSFYVAQGLTEEEAEAQYLRERIWKDDSFISDGPLYEAAVARLAELAQPVAAYEAKVMDLTGSGLPVTAGIGDTVPVRDATLGISIRTRVVRLLTRPLAPHDNEIELAYLQSRPDDSTTSRADHNGEDWLLFLNSTLADRVIDENLAILNDIGLEFSGNGQALFHLDAMGVATGTGALRVQFWDETLNELSGATDDFVFGDGEPVHLSVAFGLEGLAGQHLFSVRVQIVDGTGSVAFEAGSSRFAILAKGALGVTLPPDENVVTFAYNGTDGTDGTAQTWDVPPDVTSIVVDCYGAQGAGSLGGKGGRVRARVPVIAGETLHVYVGGQPASNGAGYNGGGAGGSLWSAGGPDGGGGAADVRRGTTLADRLIVAGAGGGEGGNSGVGDGNGGAGGAGGYPDGETGFDPVFGFGGTQSGSCGGGGTQTAGGAAGSGGGGTAGTAGALGQGGHGGNRAGGFGLGVSAGGGGGGLYGGGGAESNTFSAVSGGGGGSGAVVDPGPLIDDRPGTPTELFVENAVRSGHGQVIISWDTP